MNEIESIQIRLKEILKCFHIFCEEHSLTYYAFGGTALGAARHHGFIPWDDDVDVVLPRPDYERFIELFQKNNKDKRYILESPFSPDQFYPYPYSKIYDTGTTLIENINHRIKRGLFIDIFPLDGAGNTRREAYKIVKEVLFLSKIRKMIVCTPSSKRNTIENSFLKISNKVSDLFRIQESTIRLMIDRKCKEKKYEESSLVANLSSLGTKGLDEVIPKEYFGTPQKIQFQGLEIYCPERIDEFLSQIYGDWRKLPPKDKRITNHDFTYDLTKSYLD